MDSDGRKVYSIRPERTLIYPEENKKKRKRRRKKYALRKGETVLKHELLCASAEDPPGFAKIFINHEVGHGCFTTRDVEQGEVLLEYKGKLVSRSKGEELRRYHAENQRGCYIVDFIHNEQKMCVDATEVTTLGRFTNDSPQRYANCEMKKFVINNVPHLCIVAKKCIGANTELRYDYGDTQNLCWRRIESYKKPFTLQQAINSWKELDNNNTETSPTVAEFKPLNGEHVGGDGVKEELRNKAIRKVLRRSDDTKPARWQSIPLNLDVKPAVVESKILDAKPVYPQVTLRANDEERTR